jgi:hypothetical protein
MFDKDVNSFIFSFRQHRLLQTNHISLHPLHIFLCNTQDPLHILLEDVEFHLYRMFYSDTQSFLNFLRILNRLEVGVFARG